MLYEEKTIKNTPIVLIAIILFLTQTVFAEEIIDSYEIIPGISNQNAVKLQSYQGHEIELKEISRQENHE